MDLKQSFYIWLYPDNPIPIMADIFVASILLYLFYLVFFHNLIGYMILDWKGMFDIERKPFANNQTYIAFESGDWEKNETDVIHRIGLASSGIQDTDALVSMTAGTGYDAYEILYLMYFICRDDQEIINDRTEKTIISNTEAPFCMDGGEVIVYKDGSTNIRTAFGDIDTGIKKLREYVQNPYNFQYSTGRISLVQE